MCFDTITFHFHYQISLTSLFFEALGYFLPIKIDMAAEHGKYKSGFFILDTKLNE